MQASTSRTATASLSPASPSRVRASMRRRVDPRRSAKIAAPSVAAMMLPTSSPSLVENPNRAAATSPVINAVRAVAANASAIDGARTGRISSKPALRPPSNRISASATHADVARQGVVAEVDPAEAIRADEHPEAEEQDQAGNAKAPRDERGAKTGREQRTRDEDRNTEIDALSLASSRSARP